MNTYKYIDYTIYANGLYQCSISCNFSCGQYEYNTDDNRTMGPNKDEAGCDIEAGQMPQYYILW